MSTIRTALAAVAIAVAALSSPARAAEPPSNPPPDALVISDEALRNFAVFTSYAVVCEIDVDSVIEAPTYYLIQAAWNRRSEAERKKLGDDAIAAVEQGIAKFGLPKFCAAYNEVVTPTWRKLNDQVKERTK